jgi:6-phosphogluconolactonase (cycloisomerase 2 family)
MSPSPASRFVYVVDSGANAINGYTFDPVSATITAIAGGPTALAGKPGQAAIDATGKFLYVAVAGSPVTNAGSVAGFQINADGTLTPLSNSPYAAGVGAAGVAVSNSIK